jgi:hypothetical protein
MSFVRTASPQYFAPAAYNLLDAGGRLVVSKFDCQFKRLKHSELVALRRDVDQWAAQALKDIHARARELAAADEADALAAEADAPVATDGSGIDKMVSRQVLERVMTGWRAVLAADNSPLPWSLDNLDQTEEEFPGFINACAQSFWDSCAPKAAAHLAAKN